MKKFFLRAWQDIRTGENLDVYFTVMVCFGLVAADVIGDIDEKHLMSAILATLAILALGSLSLRHIAKEIKTSYSSSSKKLEKNSNLTANRQRMSDAKTIDWLAVSMLSLIHIRCV